MQYVGIGAKFFEKSLNDYSDWHWAIPREAMQNSIDAPGSSNISVKVEKVGDDTLLTWRNDGAPMTRSELVDKLLTLGESGKEFQGTVGGFGAAKLILMFAHRDYELFTGIYHVVGRGGEYTLEEGPYYHGTCTSVTIRGDHVDELTRNFNKFASYTQWKGKLVVNGVTCPTSLHKGKRRREFAWGTVYSHRAEGYEGLLVVRIHGIPMFVNTCGYSKGCLVAELKDGTAATLQSNRDSLKWEHQRQLNSFIADTQVDRRSALREVTSRYIRYPGPKLKRNVVGAVAQPSVSSAMIPVSFALGGVSVSAGSVAAAGIYSAAIPGLGCEFLLKNNTTRAIPRVYRPESFGRYAKKLAKTWIQVQLALHELLSGNAEFSVGFLFDKDRAAEYELSDTYGRVFYINPRLSDSGSRRRWKTTLPHGRNIISVAAHEFVHGAGYARHDEDFAAVYTQTMGLLLQQLPRLNACFH